MSIEVVELFTFFLNLCQGGLRRTSSFVRFGLLHVPTISFASMPVEAVGKDAFHRR